MEDVVLRPLHGSERQKKLLNCLWTTLFLKGVPAGEIGGFHINVSGSSPSLHYRNILLVIPTEVNGTFECECVTFACLILSNVELNCTVVSVLMEKLDVAWEEWQFFFGGGGLLAKHCLFAFHAPTPPSLSFSCPLLLVSLQGHSRPGKISHDHNRVLQRRYGECPFPGETSLLTV